MFPSFLMLLMLLLLSASFTSITFSQVQKGDPKTTGCSTIQEGEWTLDLEDFSSTKIFKKEHEVTPHFQEVYVPKSESLTDKLVANFSFNINSSSFIPIPNPRECFIQFYGVGNGFMEFNAEKKSAHVDTKPFCVAPGLYCQPDYVESHFVSAGPVAASLKIWIEGQFDLGKGLQLTTTHVEPPTIIVKEQVSFGDNDLHTSFIPHHPGDPISGIWSLGPGIPYIESPANKFKDGEVFEFIRNDHVGHNDVTRIILHSPDKQKIYDYFPA